MTFDLFMVWSNLCPICCGNTGRLLHGICKYGGEHIVAHGPLVRIVLTCQGNSNEYLQHMFKYINWVI